MFESVVEYSFNCLEAGDKTKGYQISLFIKEALCIAGPKQEQTDMKIEPRKWIVNIIIYFSAMPDHFFSWLNYIFQKIKLIYFLLDHAYAQDCKFCSFFSIQLDVVQNIRPVKL